MSIWIDVMRTFDAWIIIALLKHLFVCLQYTKVICNFLLEISVNYKITRFRAKISVYENQIWNHHLWLLILWSSHYHVREKTCLKLERQVMIKFGSLKMDHAGGTIMCSAAPYSCKNFGQSNLPLTMVDFPFVQLSYRFFLPSKQIGKH